MIFSIAVLCFFSCNNGDQIVKLLASDNINDLINGANMAGASGNKEFVPLLLKNAADLRTSTSIWHYGVNVYKAKMDALKKIFQKEPPNEIIFNKVDSVIIHFYEQLYRKEQIDSTNHFK